MGFGLHLGYSIEGAIGSIYKIDASYLSPNVNMANKLEEKTKEYKTAILISGSFYDYLSPEAKRYVRLIDLVDISCENDEPNILSKIIIFYLGLYTVDFNLDLLVKDNSEISSPVKVTKVFF
jgi:hypothetical protein